MARQKAFTLSGGQDVWMVHGRWRDGRPDAAQPALAFVIETLAGWRQIELYRRPGREDGTRVRPLNWGGFEPDEALP